MGLGLKGTLRLDVLKGGEPFEKLRRRVEEADFLQILGRMRNITIDVSLPKSNIDDSCGILK